MMPIRQVRQRCIRAVLGYVLCGIGSGVCFCIVGCKALANDQKNQTIVEQSAEGRITGNNNSQQSRTDSRNITTQTYGSNTALVLAVVILGVVLIGGMIGQTVVVVYVIWQFRYLRDKARYLAQAQKTTGVST